ncbi:MAG TPA: (2Fe-2S)-binding protein [Mycobacteriales bacterium]|nr:(2Fe-2S)-binding protein [Mycobacteriales bacterium]
MPWLPFEPVVTEPSTLERRVDDVRAALAERGDRSPDVVERQVAASITHGGLVSRLISPALGCAVVCGHVPDMTAANVWWQDTLGGPFPLSLPLDGGVSGEPEVLVEAMRSSVVAMTSAITSAVVSTCDVSPLVLAGNVAAAINAAALTIAARDLDLADRSFAIADAVRAAAGLDSEPSPTGPAFRRNSCCLAYRLNPAHRELCGDCVLR